MTHNPDRRIGAESEGVREDAETVERVARALARYDGIEICNDATYRLSSYGPKAKAAIAALTQSSSEARMRRALEPFAACCEYINDDESDEEWAKFRLLIKDYRRARAALAGGTEP